MATITFLQPAQMSSYPTDSGGGRTGSPSVNQMHIETYSLFNTNIFGTFSLGEFHWSGTITRALIGTGSFFDIEITGLSFTTSEDISWVVSTNPLQFVATLLSGNDLFIGTSGADGFIGYGGNDTVSYAGASAGVVADLDAGGLSGEATGDTYVAIENLTGSKFADSLFGNAGNNTLNGGTGADEMRGKAGNDVYIVDNAEDTVFESANQGADTVRSSVSFSLAGQSIERLELTGSANINGTGNGVANRITGNSGNNTLNGAAGNDILTGKGGADFFRFNSALNPSTNVDSVTDFQVNVDKIQLENAIFTAIGASLTADEFVANASGAAANSLQHILYDTTDGRLFYDADGSGAQAKVHFATLKAGLAIDHLDFLVI